LIRHEQEGNLTDILKAWDMEDLLTADAVGLLIEILKIKPNDRCSVENIIAHVWLQGQQNTSDKRLQVGDHLITVEV
jgi:hypothetical protein